MGEEVRDIDAAGADWIHIDVMDGHFVPNITIGPAMVKAIRPHTDKPLDVHLMIAPVDAYLAAFAAAGADAVTIHVEAGPHIHNSLQSARDLGLRTGVAVNPGTPVEAVEPVLDDVHLVLVMSVNPGFGGQKFLPSSVGRVAQVRGMIGRREVSIQVDGGVDRTTAAPLVAAGADVLVAGSAVFAGGTPDAYAANIAALRTATDAVRTARPA